MKTLFRETCVHMPGIRIEIVCDKRRSRSGEAHPAELVGLEVQNPTIRFAHSLDERHRIEAIAHELMHLLLVYRFGFGIIGRKVPRCGSREDVFNYYMNMKGDWIFLLGQITNTVHHLILVDYLRKEYGIGSTLHLGLLHRNFRILSKENSRDRESLYAKGLIAFEYQRLIGQPDRGYSPLWKADPFSRAFRTAEERFRKYSFQSIPASSAYEENILSFLEELGYPRKAFLFFPGEKS